jgi:acetoin utilization protein AcuB
LANELLTSSHMKVRERMTPNPSHVRLANTLAVARTIMRAEGFKHLPVVETKRVLGVITDHDVRQHAAHLNDTLVEAAMTADPVTVAPDTSIEEAASLVLIKRIGCLPVVENGGLVGIITTTDLLRALLDIARVRGHQAERRGADEPKP